MDFSAFLEMLKGFLPSIFASYAVEKTLDSFLDELRNHIKKRDLVGQLMRSMQVAHEKACQQLGWEYDDEACLTISAEFLSSFTGIQNAGDFCALVGKILGQTIPFEYADYWVKAFIYEVTVKFPDLYRYIMMYSNLKQDEIPEIQKQHLRHFHQPMFAELSLADIYIPNQYILSNGTSSHNDLLEMIKTFLNNKFNELLDISHSAEEITTLIISGYQGTGKSTLLDKLLDELYSGSDFPRYSVHFLSFEERDLRNIELSPRSICEYLHIESKALNGALLIIDAFDESNWAQSKAEGQLELLISELKPYQCKLIVTSRFGYLNMLEISEAVSITLLSFSIEQAELWLDYYCLCDPTMDIDEIKRNVKNIPSDIRNVILIPYIFYLCIKNHIELGRVVNLGELYDCMFKGSNCIFLKTEYSLIVRNTIAHIQKMMEIITRLSVISLLSEDNSISSTDFNKLVPEGESIAETLRTEYLLYQREGDNKYVFAHNSIPSYFVASHLYELISQSESQLSNSALLETLKSIILAPNFFSKTVMDFLEYFAHRGTGVGSQRTMDLLEGFLSGDFDEYIICTGTLDYAEKYFSTWFNGVLQLAAACNLSQKSGFSEHPFFTQLDDRKIYRFCKFYHIEDNHSLDFLRSCSFRNLCIKFLDLSGANLYGKCFRSMEMCGSQFINAILAGAYFLQSDISLSDFGDAHCLNAEFIDSVLNSCSFRNAQLNGALFLNCSLANADLRGASLNKCKFEHCVLNGMKIDSKQLKMLPYIDLAFIKTNQLVIYVEDCILPEELLADEFRRQRPVYCSIKERMPNGS